MNRLNFTLAASLFTFAALGADSARAQVGAEVSFAGPDGVTLTGVLYTPTGYADGTDYSAVIMMHGCSGMWGEKIVGKKHGGSGVRKDTPDLQNNIEKWGWALAARGMVALAVDSFTARQEPGADSVEWQDQCSGKTYAGKVNPYTTRVLDIEAARTYLLGLRDADDEAKINPNRLALLGWSHGAQAVMTEAAETPRDADTLRPLAERQRYQVAVIFYPGAGPNLGFRTNGVSYWRPAIKSVLNIAQLDSLYEDARARGQRAKDVYDDQMLDLNDYAGAKHSFDNLGNGNWPTSECTAPFTGDDCAMRHADRHSMDEIDARL